MALLSAAQLEQIRQIIRDASVAVAVSTTGLEVDDAQLQRLVDDGYLDPARVGDLTLDAFEFGQLMARLPESKDMTFSEFSRHLKANPVALTAEEKRAADIAKTRAGQYCVGLGTRYSGEVTDLGVQINEELAEQLRQGIQTEVAQAKLKRASVGTLRTKLRQMSEDWSRDWDRIASTESHLAHQQGWFEQTVKDHGEGEMLAKMPEPTACPDCLRLYTDGGKPKAMPASEWASHGVSNVGRKRADWEPVLGAMHPWCFPAGTPVQTLLGEVPIERVDVGDLVLSAFGRWRRVCQTYKHRHRGELIDLDVEGAVVSTTPNHELLGACGQWHAAERLNVGSQVRKIVLPEPEDRPAVPGKPVRLARVLLGFSPGGVPVSAVDFNGELARPVYEIDEKAAERLIALKTDPQALKGRGEFLLKIGKHAPFEGPHAPDDLVFRLDSAPAGFVGPRGELFALFGGQALHADLLCFASVSLLEPDGLDAIDNGQPGHPELAGYRLYGQIVLEVQAADSLGVNVVSSPHGVDSGSPCASVNAVSRRPWDGWVYNLGVEVDQSFTVHGVGVHNCQCQMVRIPDGFGFDDNWDLVPESMIEKSMDPHLQKGGPYIGPRGGKWADPKHTIPWDDSKHHEVTIHRKIVGAERRLTYRTVKEHADGTVTLSQHKDSDHGPRMPAESVKHFKNDLAGKVDLPKHGRAEIDAVIEGRAELLGKGDDGIAFKVGDKVVKVSTTVPFQPENPGHRSPDEAADMLERQVEVGNKLAGMGIKGIQRSEYVRHGDKGFQIKPWVEIPKRFSREQLDKIQQTVLDVHDKGYAIKDDIQPGLDGSGEPVLFDVGKAGPQGPATGIYADTRVDLDNLARLYRDHGQKFVKLGVSQGQEALARVLSKYEGWLSDGKAGLAKRHLDRAVKQLEDEARAQHKGKALERRLKEIEDETWIAREEIAMEMERAAKMEKGRKLHYRTTFAGLPISIENRKGSIRRWHDPHTETHGQTKMHCPYGYIRLTEGTDGDHVDCFLGPHESAKRVYVIHQMKAPAFKEPDEDKVMLGFLTATAAKRAYLRHFDRPEFFGSMTELSLDEFKAKIADKSFRGKMIKGQLELFEWVKSTYGDGRFGGIHGIVGNPRPVGSMGTRGDSARTPGQNTQGESLTAEQVDDHPASKKKRAKYRGRKVTIKRNTKKDVDLVGSNKTAGQWARQKPYDTVSEIIDRHAEDHRKWLDDETERRAKAADRGQLQMHPSKAR